MPQWSGFMICTTCAFCELRYSAHPRMTLCICRVQERVDSLCERIETMCSKSTTSPVLEPSTSGLSAAQNTAPLVPSDKSLASKSDHASFKDRFYFHFVLQFIEGCDYMDRTFSERENGGGG
jgi:hypothetical protein